MLDTHEAHVIPVTQIKHFWYLTGDVAPAVPWTTADLLGGEDRGLSFWSLAEDDTAEKGPHLQRPPSV